MANVVPFRRDVTRPRQATQRPPDCEPALFLLFEARGVLRRLAESGELEAGSPPAAALAYLDGAIEILDPGEADNAG
jgi:hypothetical protein